jgi:transcriptional regulator with XRE-family HTH domain
VSADDLATAMKIERSRHGLTVDDVAEQSGLSRSTWQAIEHGTRSAPNSRTLGKIDKVFGWEAGHSRSLFVYGQALPTPPPPSTNGDHDVTITIRVIITVEPVK